MSKVSFENVSENEKVKENLPFVKRNTVVCILRNPKNDTFAVLEWQKVCWKSFIGGGIEDEETVEVAAKKEIREESGFLNIKFLGLVCDNFEYKAYISHKKQNRWAYVTGVNCELIDEKFEKISKEEKKNHLVKWVKRNEVENFLNIIEHKYVWYKYNDWNWPYKKGEVIDKRVKYNLID